MKIKVLSVAIILISAMLLNAAPREQYTNFNQNFSNNIAYEINLPAKNINGRQIPAKRVMVKKVSDDFLEKNVIEVKTKSYSSNNSIKFDEPVLQSGFNFITVESIKTPYAQYVESNGLLSNDNLGIARIYQIRYSENMNPYDVCKKLMENPQIEYATPVFKRSTYGFTPNDQWYSLQYHLTKINMPDAWEVTKGDPNVVIAIVDSGTDINHEDLKSNIWTNPKEIPNNGKDDDGNGKIDDVNGWDLVGAVSAQELGSGIYKEDNNPVNMIGTHGTHTAGCAAATTNNTTGVASPGFNVKILPVKCASDAFQSPGISRGYEGILYAAKTGANVINCSWGGPGWSPVEEDIVNQAIALGSVIVVASGNSGKNIDSDPDYPASFKGVLCVGSSGNTDRASNFSSYGNAVAVYAPGENIWSTLPGNKYEAQSGTSMASPIAAGVVALLLSIHKDWTPEQVIHQLKGTSDNVLVGTNPSQRYLFFGRLNAAKALQYNNLKDKNIAGIGLQKIQISGNANAITSYDMTEVKVELKNFLAKDNNVKIKLIPVDNFIEFDKSIYDVGTMDNFQTKEISINMRLLENNPWFKGTADVLLEITGTDYINYELTQIAISVPSTNKLSQLSYIPSAYAIQWHSSAMVGNDNIYIVGSSQYPQIGGVALKANRTSSNLIQINSQAVYCLHAFDENNLIVGDGPTNGLAKVHYSSNGGTTWTTKPVNNITSFVNSFNFFSNFEGLLLGDPIGANWGVGKTVDGGNTWQLVSGLPSPIGTETGLVGSVYQKDNTVWFGTTAGRIFRTNNKGETWAASTVINGGVVSSVAASDSIAACLYSPTNTQGANRLLAISKDGGYTWTTAIYNFSTNNQIPLNVYVIEDSKSIVVQLYNGNVIASDNEGLSWYPVLSEKKAEYTYAFTNQQGNKVNIFSMGSYLTRLEFNYTPSVIKKSATFVGGNLALFDSVTVGSSKDLIVEIKNVGNYPVEISKITFTPDEGTNQNEFRILLPSPSSIIPGQNSILRLRFTPANAGMKSARLTLTTNAENPEMDLDLIGYGKTGTSVENTFNSDLIQIIPNPTSEFIKIVNIGDIQIKNVKVVDLLGNDILEINNYNVDGIINTSNLNSGSYYIVITSNSGVINKKISIFK